MTTETQALVAIWFLILMFKSIENAEKELGKEDTFRGLLFTSSAIFCAGMSLIHIGPLL